MPRVADHDQRRALIAHAFQRILAAEGLARASFVRVAEEAGISVGLIQHYFSNKEELLQFAYEDCLRRMDARIGERIRTGEAQGRPIFDLMRAGLEELLPVDERRSVEYRVRQNLLTQSLNDPRLAGVVQRAAVDLRRRVAQAVENGKECGEVRPEVDSDWAASMVLAAAHGLESMMAVEAPAEVAADGPGSVLRPVIGIVFTGRCRHYDN